MNDCEYYQELISRMLDEELTAEEHAALKSHLESCTQCRLMHEAFSAVSRLAGEVEEPPKALHESIMADIRRAGIKEKNRRMRPVLAAAACLAVVLLGVWGMSGRLSLEKSHETAAMSADFEVPCDVLPQDYAEAAEEAAPTEAYVTGGQSVGNVAAARDSNTAEAYSESDGAQGEYIYIEDTESLESLLTLLAAEPTAAPEDELSTLYTVVCEQSIGPIVIYESDSGLFYSDSSDSQWYLCTCSRDELGIFFAHLGTK